MREINAKALALWRYRETRQWPHPDHETYGEIAMTTMVSALFASGWEPLQVTVDLQEGTLRWTSNITVDDVGIETFQAVLEDFADMRKPTIVKILSAIHPAADPATRATGWPAFGTLYLRHFRAAQLKLGVGAPLDAVAAAADEVAQAEPMQEAPVPEVSKPKGVDAIPDIIRQGTPGQSLGDLLPFTGSSIVAGSAVLRVTAVRKDEDHGRYVIETAIPDDPEAKGLSLVLQMEDGAPVIRQKAAE